MAQFKQDLNFPTLSSSQTLYRQGNTIFVAGTGVLGGVYFDGVAKIDTVSNQVTAINFNWLNPAYHFVSDFVLLNGIFYLIGSFDTPATRSFCAFDMHGNLLAWNPDSNAAPQVIVTDGYSLFIGGQFNSIGGLPRNKVAKISPATGLADPAWDANITTGTYVSTMFITNDMLYLSGSKFFFGAVPRDGAASLSLTTGALSAWDPQLSPAFTTIFDFSEINGDLVIAGNFTSVSGDVRNGLARVDKDTGAPFPGFDAAAYIGTPFCFAVTVYGNTVVVGGSFPDKILFLDAATGNPTGDSLDLDPSELTGVSLLLNHSNKIFFTSNNTNPAYNLAAFFLQDPPPDPPVGTPRKPVLSWLLRKDGQTLLKWVTVVFDVYNNRIPVTGYKVYRSNNENLESFELIRDITTKDASGNVDTMFTENAQGFYAYQVTALLGPLESEPMVAKQVNSAFGADFI